MPKANSDKQKIIFGVSLVTLLTALTRFTNLSRTPPGMWFDEAWVSVVARDWGNELYYSASFGGMHPGIVYLTKLGQALIQADPLTIRYVVAAVSTLTIPIAYIAFFQLFSLDRSAKEARPSALIATAVLSIIYPFFHFSRLGLESILPTPMAIIAFGLCASYLKEQQAKSSYFSLKSLVLGGWLGLGLYTFDTSRFIPLAVAFALIWLWACRRQYWPLKHAFSNLVIITVTAVIVAAPLLNYFWLNWADFTGRALITTSQTLGEEAGFVPLALLTSAGKTVAGLFIPGFGDEITRHNLPGRPVFDALLSLFFLGGLIQLGRQRKNDLTPILAIWLSVTLLPVILTNGAPTYTRIFGAIPALAMIIALGAQSLPSRLPTGNTQLGKWIIPLGLSISALITGYDYFVRWPKTPAYFNDFQTAEWDIANRALAETEQTAVFFLPRRPYLADPTYDLQLNGTPIRQLPDSSCLAYRPDETNSYVLNGFQTDEWVTDLTKQFGADRIQTAEEIIARNQQDRIGQVVKLIPPLPAEAMASPHTSFGGYFKLVGHDGLPSTITAGSPLDISFHWQAESATIPQPYTLFIHLYASPDPSGAPLAQLDSQPCIPTSAWQNGDVLIDQKRLFLPEDLPEGRYTIALGWYDPNTFARLALSGEQARPDNLYLLQEITIVK